VAVSVNVLDMFYPSRYCRAMTETPHLRPATTDEITEALAFALRYDGRRRVFTADEPMARITADRLVRHLEGSGFVVMKAPPAATPTTREMPSTR
jgi:hypothetical protein